MDILERIKKEARASVTTKEIFVSKSMCDLIGSKLSLICKEYRVAVPSLEMMFDDSAEMAACTSLSDMIINSGHEMFDGDDESRFLKVCGVLLHEVGHIIFTNYTAYYTWEERISLGIFYPSEPVALRSDQAEKIKAFATGPMKSTFLSIAHTVSNILEDGRIENFILKYVGNARFMKKGLVRFRQETYAKIRTFEQLITEADSGNIPKLAAVFQLMLCYARFREVKGSLDPHSEIGELLLKIMPEIDVYMNETEAVVCYGAFNNILILLADLIGESLCDAIDNRQSLSSGQKERMKDMSGCGGSSSQQDESGNTDPGGSAQDAGPDSESSMDAGSTEASAGENDPSGSDAEEQAKILSAASEIEEQLNEMLDRLEGMTIDQSENMGEKARGSDRSSVKRQLSRMDLNGQGGKVTGPDACEADKGSGAVTHETADDTDLGLILGDIARKISDEKAESLISEEVTRSYSDVSRSVKDYSEIHRYTDIKMFHYAHVTEDDKALYDQVAKAVSPMVRRAVKSSNFYEKDRDAYTEYGLYSGNVLHAESSYRKDGRLFSKTYERDEPPKIAVAVRIDCSGSMCGDRLEAARRCCVFLYEYVLGMEKRYNVRIPLYIYGDNVSSDVQMFVFADAGFRTPNEKYRLMRLASGGCNRDGLPIRMAVKRLEQEQPFAQKILFNITDGQPNDQGYGGEPAYEDLRDITRYCERKRIALAACAIGSDRSTIEKIYGSNHFINISDLDELPVRLVRIMKKLLK